MQIVARTTYAATRRMNRGLCQKKEGTEMFEIVLNGMVYRFEESRLFEIMEALDQMADEVSEE